MAGNDNFMDAVNTGKLVKGPQEAIHMCVYNIESIYLSIIYLSLYYLSVSSILSN